MVSSINDNGIIEGKRVKMDAYIKLIAKIKSNGLKS